ncbi:MAG: hypothetical protein K2R98_13665 [Gemmataceae bacterium]|nr:hypothetical protein [Gemmataceae bacterium]
MTQPLLDPQSEIERLRELNRRWKGIVLVGGAVLGFLSVFAVLQLIAMLFACRNLYEMRSDAARVRRETAEYTQDLGSVVKQSDDAAVSAASFSEAVLAVQRVQLVDAAREAEALVEGLPEGSDEREAALKVLRQRTKALIENQAASGRARNRFQSLSRQQAWTQRPRIEMKAAVPSTEP